MFSPSMLDPAIMSFFKQAGEAFKQTVEAEAAGRMAKALEKRCGSTLPPDINHPAFPNRCLLYMAKAYAMAHIDGQVTWGGVKAIAEQSSIWPPPADVKAQGALFQAFMLGFLYGSELPLKRQQTIEGLIPMGARVASDPESLARSLGIKPEQMAQMAQMAQSAGGIGNLMNFLGNKKS